MLIPYTHQTENHHKRTAITNLGKIKVSQPPCPWVFWASPKIPRRCWSDPLGRRGQRPSPSGSFDEDPFPSAGHQSFTPKKHIGQYGGFQSHGGTPISGWFFLEKNSSRNGWNGNICQWCSNLPQVPRWAPKALAQLEETCSQCSHTSGHRNFTGPTVNAEY